MNNNHHIKLCFIFILLFMFSTLLPYSSQAKTSQDSLISCINELMGMDVINEYYEQIRKKLFTENDIADYGEHVRYLVLPSFANEEYLGIYKMNQGTYRLEYSRPSSQIWGSMPHHSVPDRYEQPPEIKDIKITISRKQITEDLSKSVSMVWWEMIKKQKVPTENDFAVLDGTTYIFSSGLFNCGMSLGTGGDNVETIIEIGKQLKAYSLQEGSSQETEKAIIDLANKLYTKLTTQQ